MSPKPAVTFAVSLVVVAVLSAGAVEWLHRSRPEPPSVLASCRDAIPVGPCDILVLGDSITALPEWHELLGTKATRNRTKSGSYSSHVANQSIPRCRTVILSTGINDIQGGIARAVTVKNLAIIGANLAGSRVFVIPPMAPNVAKFSRILAPRHRGIHVVTPEEAERLRSDIAEAIPGSVIIDVSGMLQDGRLRDDMTDDGLHPNGTGYLFIAKQLLEAGVCR